MADLVTACRERDASLRPNAAGEHTALQDFLQQLGCRAGTVHVKHDAWGDAPDRSARLKQAVTIVKSDVCRDCGTASG